MKHLYKIIIFIIFLLTVNKANAYNLLDSLSSAYLNNHKLNAERASLRANKEETKEAVSEFLPSITISGYVSEQENTNPGSNTNFKPSEKSMVVEQKIFQGFGGVANLKKKNSGYTLGEFKLKKTEQEILLLAAQAHTELILNKKKVNINLINVDLLERQVENDQNRLETGEISLTDLAQSESSLAGSKAELIQAQNDLVTSKSTFEKIIGNKPIDNIQDIKEFNMKLPKSLAAAYNISSSENPDLKISFLEYKQSKLDVVIAASDLSPSATLSYKVAEQDNFSSTVTDRTQQTLTATATWPLFSGGSNLYSLKKAKEIRNQKELLFEDSKKTVETEVANAWSLYQSSKSVLEAVRSQVKAAEIASEGITLEYESGGSRSTLEIIQSRKILLDSRIDLASSERNFLLSKFTLLQAVGRLTANQLNLKQ